MRPPKGYRSQEYPLYHNMEYKFQLDVEDETKNSTICSLIRGVNLAGAEAVEVAPTNFNYAEDTGTEVFRGSIVPKMTIDITARINGTANAIDPIPSMIFKWMPIYSSFLSSLDAADHSGLGDIEATLELQHDIVEERVNPLFSTVKLGTFGSGTQPLSIIPETEVFGDIDLAASAVLESVAFDEKNFWDIKRIGSNAGMLNKVTGSMKTVKLNYDRGQYHYFSNNFTNPIVKRSNAYTFCGILFHVPQANEFQQLCDSVEITTSVNQISFGVRCQFEEWNQDFDQTSE